VILNKKVQTFSAVTRDYLDMRWEKDGIAVEVLFSKAGLATQILVTTEETAFLIDAGDGTLRDLIHKNFLPQRLKGIFFTHGHADHMAGLYGILGFLRAENHTGTFRIWYPKGCEEIRAVIDAFRRCYKNTTPFTLVEHALNDGDEVEIGQIKVLAREVKHWHSIKGQPLGPVPAMGYRLESRGITIAVTGDTAPCPSVVELVQDADLALIEASLPDEASEKQKMFLHLTHSEAKKLGTLARDFCFIHLPKD